MPAYHLEGNEAFDNRRLLWFTPVDFRYVWLECNAGIGNHPALFRRRIHSVISIASRDSRMDVHVRTDNVIHDFCLTMYDGLTLLRAVNTIVYVIRGVINGIGDQSLLAWGRAVFREGNALHDINEIILTTLRIYTEYPPLSVLTYNIICILYYLRIPPSLVVDPPNGPDYYDNGIVILTRAKAEGFNCIIEKLCDLRFNRERLLVLLNSDQRVRFFTVAI